MSKHREIPEYLGTPEDPKSSHRGEGRWIKIGDTLPVLTAEGIRKLLYSGTEGLSDAIPVGEDGLKMCNPDGSPVLSQVQQRVMNNVMRVFVLSDEGLLVPFGACRPIASGYTGYEKLANVSSSPLSWGTHTCHRECVEGRVVVYYRVFTVDQNGVVIGIQDGLRGHSSQDCNYIDPVRTMMANPLKVEEPWGWDRGKSGWDNWF